VTNGLFLCNLLEEVESYRSEEMVVLAYLLPFGCQSSMGQKAGHARSIKRQLRCKINFAKNYLLKIISWQHCKYIYHHRVYKIIKLNVEIYSQSIWGGQCLAHTKNSFSSTCYHCVALRDRTSSLETVDGSTIRHQLHSYMQDKPSHYNRNAAASGHCMLRWLQVTNALSIVDFSTRFSSRPNWIGSLHRNKINELSFFRDSIVKLLPSSRL
jgi:hypothetical protein